MNDFVKISQFSGDVTYIRRSSVISVQSHDRDKCSIHTSDGQKFIVDCPPDEMMRLIFG